MLHKIENEYGIVEYHYGKPGKRYMHWAAEMALALDTGVPWIMCKQSDAPAPIVSLYMFTLSWLLLLYHLIHLLLSD